MNYLLLLSGVLASMFQNCDFIGEEDSSIVDGLQASVTSVERMENASIEISYRLDRLSEGAWLLDICVPLNLHYQDATGADIGEIEIVTIALGRPFITGDNSSVDATFNIIPLEDAVSVKIRLAATNLVTEKIIFPN